jgi:hypothetical protein
VEAKFLDGALEFVRRRVGGEQWQVREAAIARRMAVAGRCQGVVVGPRQRDPLLPRNKVRSWAGDREHLHGDPAGIHVRAPRVAEVREFVAFGGLRPDEVRTGKAATGNGIGRDAGDEVRNGKVFFQCNDTHVSFSPCHWVGGWAWSRNHLVIG